MRLRVICWKSANLIFTVTVRPERLRLLAPGPDLVGHRARRRPRSRPGRSGRRSKVVSEPDDLRAVGHRPARSSSPRAIRSTSGPTLPKCCCRKASGCARRSAPVSMPSRFIFAAVTGPTPWKRPTGKPSTKAAPMLRRDDELAVGLALVRGELGEELVVGDAGRGGEAGLREDAGADLLGRRRRGGDAAPVLGHVEIGFVERQRLDQGV